MNPATNGRRGASRCPDKHHHARVSTPSNNGARSGHAATAAPGSSNRGCRLVHTPIPTPPASRQRPRPGRQTTAASRRPPGRSNTLDRLYPVRPPDYWRCPYRSTPALAAPLHLNANPDHHCTHALSYRQWPARSPRAPATPLRSRAMTPCPHYVVGQLHLIQAVP